MKNEAMITPTINTVVTSTTPRFLVERVIGVGAGGVSAIEGSGGFCGMVGGGGTKIMGSLRGFTGALRCSGPAHLWVSGKRWLEQKLLPQRRHW